MVSWAADGKVAAEMALKILDGAKPQDIPIVKNNNIYLFDWRALRRWDSGRATFHRAAWWFSANCPSGNALDGSGSVR